MGNTGLGNWEHRRKGNTGLGNGEHRFEEWVNSFLEIGNTEGL